MTKRLLLAAFAAVVGVSTLLAGCVPLVVGGAVAGTALVATDRRSVGGGPRGLLGYLIVGLIGAFVGNFVLNAVGWKPKLGNDLADSIAISAIGAIVVVILAKLIIFS